MCVRSQPPQERDPSGSRRPSEHDLADHLRRVHIKDVLPSPERLLGTESVPSDLAESCARERDARGLIRRPHPRPHPHAPPPLGDRAPPPDRRRPDAAPPGPPLADHKCQIRPAASRHALQFERPDWFAFEANDVEAGVGRAQVVDDPLPDAPLSPPPATFEIARGRAIIEPARPLAGRDQGITGDAPEANDAA